MLSAPWRGPALRAVAKRIPSAVPKTSRTTLLNRNLNKVPNTSTFRCSSTAGNATREIVSQALRSIGSVGSLPKYLPTYLSFSSTRREG